LSREDALCLRDKSEGNIWVAIFLGISKTNEGEKFAGKGIKVILYPRQILDAAGGAINRNRNHKSISKGSEKKFTKTETNSQDMECEIMSHTAERKRREKLRRTIRK